jgi:hypothetical protein
VLYYFIKNSLLTSSLLISRSTHMTRVLPTRSYGKQLTVCWHVVDLFLGHEDFTVVSNFLRWLSSRYDTTGKKLNIVCGPRHDYLGMNLDFSKPGEVQIDMIPYIQKNISAFPEKIMGVQSTPAGNHLFQIQPPAEARPLPEEQACIYHHTTA